MAKIKILKAWHNIKLNNLKAGTDDEINIDNLSEAIVKTTAFIEAVENSDTASELLAHKNASNGYMGLTGYAGTFWNTAKTFLTTLTGTATATRSILLPDESGTVALIEDITEPVQSDWNETDDAQLGFIQNKPDLMWKNEQTPLYGRLYNWFAVDTGKLAPAGWHVPTNNDFTTLATYLSTNVGYKLREAGTAHWKSPNTGATNSSGFTALPNSARENNGSFELGFDQGLSSFLWTATSISPTTAHFGQLSYGNSLLVMDSVSWNPTKAAGMAVRCIKDNNIPSTEVITDIDGNVYTEVVIGTQIWMVQNLATTRYNDGSSIPNITDNTAWSELSTDAYCNLGNVSTYVFGVNSDYIEPTNDKKILARFIEDKTIARTTGTTSSNTPVLSVDSTFERLYYTVTSGTGDATLSFSAYPLINAETLLIISNSRGTDMNLVFPTADITSGGITYRFYKQADSVTVKNGETAEVNFLYDVIDSTHIAVRIATQAFNTQSS